MGAHTISWLGNTANIWGESIVRACWQGSVFILAVWIVCRLLVLLPPAARHWLWWLACLKLIVSLIWVAPLNVPILPASVPRLSAIGSQHELPAPPIEIGRSVDSRSPKVEAASPRIPMQVVVFAIWLIGAAACLIRIAKQSISIRRITDNGFSLDDTAYGAQCRQVGVLLGVRRSPHLVSSTQVSSPMVVGFFTPTIVVPEGLCDLLSPEEFRAVLAHELAHVRRNDLLVGIIPTLAYSVFFALPPLWLAYREWQTAREAACDAEALTATGVPAVRYAQLLLKIVGQDSRTGFQSALGATAGYHTLKSRLQLLKAWSAGNVPNLRAMTGVLALAALLCVAPWRITARQSTSTQSALASVTPTRKGNAAPRTEIPADVADVSSQDLFAEGDVNKRYLLMGPRDGAPANGYHLLIVLPGGDGSADFQWFVRRILKFGLSKDYLIAQPIAPVWSPDQAENVVWPTETNPWHRMKFSTEEFVDAVIRDVVKRRKIDSRFVFTLGWASGGPPAYAVSLRPHKSVTGSFIAMSIFNQHTLPSLTYADGQPYYLLHPSDAAIVPLKDAKHAQEMLARNGATVKLATYEGGYGWYGNVYDEINSGVRWLETHHAK